MFVILGSIVLLAAVIIGIAGVLANAGAPHLLTDQFALLGYHITGSTGTVFLYGIVVGAVAGMGFSMMLAGAWYTAGLGAHRTPARSEPDAHLPNDGSAPGTANLSTQPADRRPPARAAARSTNAVAARHRPQLVPHPRALFPGRRTAGDQTKPIDAAVKQHTGPAH